MKLISHLSDMIEEELDGAEQYIKCAMKWKEEKPALATTFMRLSSEELSHVNLLHEQVVLLIQEYKKENGEPSEKMQGIYDYLHQRHIEKAAAIKYLHGIYKG